MAGDNTKQRLVKVLFKVDEGEEGIEAETVWARALGDGHYMIENAPYCAYNVSLHDVVFAPHIGVDKIPVFESVVSKSGNRNFRVILQNSIFSKIKARQLLARLASIGCAYEAANNNFLALVVPCSTEIKEVRRILRKSAFRWEQSDPAYDGLYPEEIL